MSANYLETAIDYMEIHEACEELRSWYRRIDALPDYLRTEISAINGLRAESLVAAAFVGGEIVVELTPRFRALVANLRAQGGKTG